MCKLSDTGCFSSSYDTAVLCPVLKLVALMQCSSLRHKLTPPAASLPRLTASFLSNLST